MMNEMYDGYHVTYKLNHTSMYLINIHLNEIYFLSLVCDIYKKSLLSYVMSK